MAVGHLLLGGRQATVGIQLHFHHEDALGMTSHKVDAALGYMTLLIQFAVTEIEDMLDDEYETLLHRLQAGEELRGAGKAHAVY